MAAVAKQLEEESAQWTALEEASRVGPSPDDAAAMIAALAKEAKEAAEAVKAMLAAEAAAAASGDGSASLAGAGITPTLPNFSA